MLTYVSPAASPVLSVGRPKFTVTPFAEPA